MKRKFKIGDIVINIEDNGYKGRYGRVKEEWFDGVSPGVRFVDQYGIDRSWYETRLDFKCRAVKVYAIVKFMENITTKEST